MLIPVHLECDANWIFKRSPTQANHLGTHSCIPHGFGLALLRFRAQHRFTEKEHDIGD